MPWSSSFTGSPARGATICEPVTGTKEIGWSSERFDPIAAAPVSRPDPSTPVIGIAPRDSVDPIATVPSWQLRHSFADPVGAPGEAAIVLLL